MSGLDNFEDEDDTITFREYDEEETQTANNRKKFTIQERMEQNRKSIEDDIRDITIRKDRIQKILKSDHAGSKLSGSVWPEQNIFENTDQGRIFSMSDVNLKTLIDFHTNEGDKILDPFAGYLNSAETILKMDRKYEGYEINTVYFSKLKEKLDNLKHKRETMGMGTPEYDIYNMNSGDMQKNDPVDMVLTTLPEPVFTQSNHKTREMIEDGYYSYIDTMVPILLRVYQRLKDNGFFVIHFRDSVRGFVYKPVFIDLPNVLREVMPMKYLLILAENRSASGTLGDNGEMFKLYSEQTFPYSHQYVLCFYKGEGRLR